MPIPNILPKTPIFIDFIETYPQILGTTELNIFEQDPIDIYNPANNDTVANASHILAPRYYIIIHRPVNSPGPDIKIDIHKSPNSLLQNKLRVALPPSIGYGINASYKVEYWEWRPLININAQITNKLLWSEYWYVPSIDNCSFIATYPFDARLNSWYHKTLFTEPFHQPRLTQRSISVNRTVNTTNVIDIITTSNDSDIFCFIPDDILSFSDTVSQEVIPFNSQTSSWTFSKILTSSSIVRSLNTAGGSLINGSINIDIRYINPFHSSQIICEENQYLLTNDNYHYII